MQLFISDRFCQGGFADLFRSADGRTVYKLFRRYRADPDGKGVHAVFLAESAAYWRAQDHTRLRRHVPRFYGTVAISDVLADDRASVAHSYHLDCCYGLEYVAGEGRKYGWLPEPIQPTAEALFEQFEGAGIDYVRDAHLFGWEGAGVLTLVDIATHDVVAEHLDLFRDVPAGA